MLATGVGVHQTALYDMILAWILFAILWGSDKKPRREGVFALTFGLYYGCCRLLEDSLRIDKRFGPFTGSQWTALTVAVDLGGHLDLVGGPVAAPTARWRRRRRTAVRRPAARTRDKTANPNG